MEWEGLGLVGVGWPVSDGKEVWWGRSSVGGSRGGRVLRKERRGD